MGLKSWRYKKSASDDRDLTARTVGRGHWLTAPGNPGPNRYTLATQALTDTP